MQHVTALMATFKDSLEVLSSVVLAVVGLLEGTWWG